MPRSSRHPTPFAAAADTRIRLVAGMTAALVEKGYAEVTVADVVRHARVSKRTFYEHFPDKEGCYLAAFVMASDQMLARVAEAANPGETTEASIVRATHEYLSTLQEVPQLTRTFLTELPGAGAEALRVRRSVHRRFADMLRGLVERGRKERPHVPPLSPRMAMAIGCGVNEVVMYEIEEGRGDRLVDASEVVVALWRFVLMPGVAPDAVAREPRTTEIPETPRVGVAPVASVP